MDIQSSLKYPLTDPESKKKLGIGVLCWFPGMLLLFCGPIFLAGYCIGAMRMVMRGEEERLPEWPYFSDYFRWGLMSAGVSLAYFGAPFALFTGSAVVTGLSLFGRSTSEAASTFNLTAVLLGILALVLIVPALFVFPLVLARMASADSLGEAFHFRDIMRQAQEQPKALGILMVLNVLMLVATNFLGAFLDSFMGWFSFIPLGLLCTYTWLVMAHLVGSTYRNLYGTEVRAAASTTEGMGIEHSKWHQD